MFMQIICERERVATKLATILTYNVNFIRVATLNMTYMYRMNILYCIIVTAATKPDPNAPRPEGQTLRPVTGESLQVVC